MVNSYTPKPGHLIWLSFSPQDESHQEYFNLEKILAPQPEALHLDLLELPHSPPTRSRIQQIFNSFLLKELQLIDDEHHLIDNPPMIILSIDSPKAQFIVNQVWKYQRFFNNAQLGVKITTQTLNKPVQFLRNWLGTLGITIKMLPRFSAENSREYIVDQNLISVLQQHQAKHKQAQKKPALVLSPASYNKRTQLALLCPITKQEQGYPYEVKLPNGLFLQGVILADQIKSLDWKARQAIYEETLPSNTFQEVIEKLQTLLSSSLPSKLVG